MCSTIMNLLSLANEDSVPGADDFVPVLVFVLIRVSLFFILPFLLPQCNFFNFNCKNLDDLLTFKIKKSPS